MQNKGVSHIVREKYPSSEAICRLTVSQGEGSDSSVHLLCRNEYAENLLWDNLFVV